jgi:hypothetical protein
MKAQPEIFKGIEYVRISSLPGDQREKIWKSFEHNKIIKIVQDQALLNDCILYQDYITWHGEYQALPSSAQVPQSPSRQPSFGKLAFK